MMISLLLICSFISNAVSLDCWEGASSTKSINYPPEVVTCDTNSICRRDKYSIDDFYYMSCSTPIGCQIAQKDVGNTATSLYSEVICCTTNLCNSYPGQTKPDGFNMTSGGGGGGGNNFFNLDKLLPLFIVFVVQMLCYFY